jgi:hypothetical protein
MGDDGELPAIVASFNQPPNNFRRAADQPLCCRIQPSEVEAKKNPKDYLLTSPIRFVIFPTSRARG